MNFERFVAFWNVFKKSSWLINIVTLVLLVVGILFVYSACYVDDDILMRPLYLRQIVWAVAGIGCYLSVSVVDYRQLKRYEWGIYATALFLLVLVLLVGQTIYGAKRWLSLTGAGGLGIQPSEIAKLATIVLLAGRLSEPGRNRRRPRELFLTLLLVAIPAVLILRQPDLGTALVFVPTSFVIMFVAGVPFRYIGGLAGAGIAFVLLILAALFLPAKLGASENWQDRIASWTGLSEYQRGRIEVFVYPETDPLGAGWNKRQSEIAVGSGGPLGKGYLQGTQNILGFLPRSVAPTDFIFSVIAEEMGFAGAIVILGMFMALLYAALATAQVTLDPLGRLLCVGVAAMLFFHLFINVAMTIGLMPITGLPLPLLSYGGSFMLVTMTALGVVQSVHIRIDRRESYR